MERLIQRKGIAGFSEDPGGVLAGFAYFLARQTSSGLNIGSISIAVKNIPNGRRELKDAAVRLQDYVKNLQEEAQKVRGLLLAQYLGGLIASAMVNLAQHIAVSFPSLSQYVRVRSAVWKMTRAMADPAAFAERAVNETQFAYGKGAKPRWARGAIGSRFLP